MKPNNIVHGRIVPKHLSRAAYARGLTLRSSVLTGIARYMTRVQPGVVDLQVLPTPKTHKIDFVSFLMNVGYSLDETVQVQQFLTDVMEVLNFRGVDTSTVTARMLEMGWGPKAVSTPLQIFGRIGIQISTNGKGKNKTRWINPISTQQTIVSWIKGEVTSIPTSRVVTMANRYVMDVVIVDPSAKDSPDKVFEARCFGRGYVVFDRDTLRAYLVDVISYENVKGIVRVTKEVMASKLIVHDSPTQKIGEVPFTTNFLDVLFEQGSVSLEIMGITTQAQFDHYIKLAARKGLDTEFEYRLDKVTTANKVNAKNTTATTIAGELEQVTIGETTIPTAKRQQIGQTALQTNDGIEPTVDTQVLAYAGGSGRGFLPTVDLSQPTN